MESDNKQSTRAKYIARLRAENKAYEEENEKLGRQQEEFINKIVEMEATIDALIAERDALIAERDEAQREWCYMESCRRVEYAIEPAGEPSIAAERGWDCFGQGAVREAAKMRGEEVVYCDACGEDLRGLLKVPFSSLPIDVASANAGESAVLCRDCHVIMIQKMEEEEEEEDPDYDPPRGGDWVDDGT